MFLVALAAMFGTLIVLAAIVQRRKNGQEENDFQSRNDVRFEFVGGRHVSQERLGPEHDPRD